MKRFIIFLRTFLHKPYRFEESFIESLSSPCDSSDYGNDKIEHFTFAQGMCNGHTIK